MKTTQQIIELLEGRLDKYRRQRDIAEQATQNAENAFMPDLKKRAPYRRQQVENWELLISELRNILLEISK